MPPRGRERELALREVMSHKNELCPVDGATCKRCWHKASRQHMVDDLTLPRREVLDLPEQERLASVRLPGVVGCHNLPVAERSLTAAPSVRSTTISCRWFLGLLPVLLSSPHRAP